jgi:ABC-type Mn2+/Zn2+ transport system ATPase subunit
MFVLDGVRVRFGHHLALDIDRLTLDAGTSVAVMGPNGSGKTTLLRVLAGLLEPTSGRLVTQDRPVVAYVAQHQHQHPWMPLTVTEVLRMGRYRHRGLFRPLRRADRRTIQLVAERLEVTDLLGRPFGQLSGGQRQRVLMAGALANEADCLLLDEPITGLDLPSQRLILDVIEGERDDGRLVVLTTHHLEEAERCDRVLLLNTRVVADGPPEQALTEEHLADAFGARLMGGEHHGHHHGRGDPGHRGAGVRPGGPVIVIDEHGHGHRRGAGPGSAGSYSGWSTKS